MGLFDNYLEDSEDDFLGISKVSKKKQQTDENREDYNDDDYLSLSKEEKKEKVRKLKIENESKLRALVEKDLVTSIFGEMGQSIQNNVVDQAKRKANTWAALLGIPGKERDIEKLLSDLGEEIVNGLTGDIERLVNDEVWE